jgi:hypothetical protein
MVGTGTGPAVPAGPAIREVVTHMLCRSWAMSFRRRTPREPRRIELGLVDRPGPLHDAIEGGRHPPDDRVLNPALDVLGRVSGLRSYHWR